MVLQVFTNTRQVCDRRNTQLMQTLRRTNTGALQNLRTTNGACCQQGFHHMACKFSGNVKLPAQFTDIGDAGGAHAGKADFHLA